MFFSNGWATFGKSGVAIVHYVLHISFFVAMLEALQSKRIQSVTKRYKRITYLPRFSAGYPTAPATIGCCYRVHQIVPGRIPAWEKLGSRSRPTVSKSHVGSLLSSLILQMCVSTSRPNISGRVPARYSNRQCSGKQTVRLGGSVCGHRSCVFFTVISQGDLSIGGVPGRCSSLCPPALPYAAVAVFQSSTRLSSSSTRLPPIASCSRVHPDPDRDSLRRRVFWSREGALQISCGSFLIYSWFTWPNSTHKALFSAAHLRFPRQVPHVIAAPKYTPFSFPQSPTWV